jgi:fructan beta-fructosidase
VTATDGTDGFTVSRRDVLKGGLAVTGGAMLLAALPTLGVLPATPAFAGELADYPEFPYSPTDYGEALRGQFHFSPRRGWMNDPNGLLYYNGLYHFFFQHNPHGLVWDTMHWGHATSPDLVHWTQKPIALEPGVHPGNLWSGAGVVDTANATGLRTGADAPIVVFTGTDGVEVMYSTDGARTFQSYRDGLKVVTPAGGSRDPKVRWDAARQRWVMVVWTDNGGNGADFLTSTNLLDWTFRSRFAAGWLFECPDFFQLPVDDNPARQKWVLTHAGGNYVIGSFDGTRFSSDWASPERMDMGRNSPDGTFYAGQTFNDLPDGRVVQMVWQAGNHGSVWTGNASFPAQLRLVTTPAGIRLTRTPVAELSLLYADTSRWGARMITPDPATDPFAGISADTYEIRAEFDLTGATARQFGFQLHRRPDGSYDRAVGYDRIAQTLYGAPLAPVGGRITMRLLVDRGQLEVFGNGGLLSITDNVDFNSAPASQGIRLYATGGSVRLVSAELHPLRSAWGFGEPTLESNLAGPWHVAAGGWTDVAAGKQSTSGGDAFYLSATTAADFTYEGDVTVLDGVAAALTFRASSDATAHYTTNIDVAAGVVKLWRPGRDIATFPTAIVRGRTYHLRVVAAGPRIRVFLDHGTTPVIDAMDSTYRSGLLGANVFGGTGTVQNLTLNGPGFVTNLAGPWTPTAGTWTVTAVRPGLHGSGPGDAFFLSRTTAADFAYEGDVTIVNGVAAALTFRANADATAHYTANIDAAAGVVKLWRPGRDIATFPTPVVQGRTYHLRVEATGPRIRVFLNRGATPVIDATDSTYATGLLGVNLFHGTATFQNLTRS